MSAAEFAAAMAPLGPFGAAPALAVGVSGGPDSLALTLLARGWAAARGGSVLALVADHGLRPESGAEAAGVAAALIARGIATRVLALAVPAGGGLQARARTARLAALADAAAAAGRPWLLLGQHRADQAETVLLRGLAGSDATGLAGMAPVRSAGAVLLLRPLLRFDPARLEAAIAAAGMLPVRDPSNADARFGRVRIRAALAGNTTANLVLDAAAGRFGARRAALAAAVAVRLAASATLFAAGDARVDLATLGDDPVADAALAALIRAVGGGRYAPATAAARALRKRGVGTLGGARLRPAGDTHHLAREVAAVAAPVAAERGAIWDGRFRLDGAGDPACTLGALGVEARLPAASRLPASVAATLPAIRRDGVLEAVPLLDYPDPATARRFAIRFAPAAGPAVVAWDMAVAGNAPHVSLGAAQPGPLERDRHT